MRRCFLPVSLAPRGLATARAAVAVAALFLALALPAAATSIIPISDAELYLRADVVVHGVVLSNRTQADGNGRPETVTVIQPLAVVKGRLAGPLVIHQTGGVLPGGRFFQLWGRPEYREGSEVVVFAIARRGGDFQTAEMLLGKFEVWQDAAARRFAIPDSTLAAHPGLTYYSSAQDLATGRPSGPPASRPRELARFLEALRRGSVARMPASPAPSGALKAVEHPKSGRVVKPLWGNINNSLWRWNNNATAVWSFNGTANITGGGTAEATNALAAWTNDPNSNINYTAGSGSNVIYLNATTSNLGCGWSTCLSGSGVIGCGGPSGGGSNTWRGESYTTISSGTVELRSYCTVNLYSSAVTQAVLEHELGHTLGLGHSDQNVSTHDVCRGDEDAAIMRSVVQSTTPLGTDDQDAIRWIYGDGLNSCGGITATPTQTPTITPTRTPTRTPTPAPPTSTPTRTPTVTPTRTPSPSPTQTPTRTITPTPTITRTPTQTPTRTPSPLPTSTPTPAPPTATPTPTAPPVPRMFYTQMPCRIADTRTAPGQNGGPAMAAGESRSFAVVGVCGIPATAHGVALNVTATLSSDPGFFVVYPGGTATPGTSTLNYHAGQTRANNVVVGLGPSGDILVYCNQTVGTAHVVIDVNGWFE